MDERIMNLVSLIANQVQNRQDLFRDEGKIMSALMKSGYRFHEADTALALMQSLAGGADEDRGDKRRHDTAVRAMSFHERSRFTVEAFGFIVKLARLGIVTYEQREEIVEKALALHRRKIGIDDIKTLFAVNLFADAEDYESMLTSAMDRTGTAWN